MLSYVGPSPTVLLHLCVVEVVDKKKKQEHKPLNALTWIFDPIINVGQTSSTVFLLFLSPTLQFTPRLLGLSPPPNISLLLFIQHYLSPLPSLPLWQSEHPSVFQMKRWAVSSDVVDSVVAWLLYDSVLIICSVELHTEWVCISYCV